MFAFAWASGLIEFGPRVPDGALPIMRGRAKAVRERVSACARHAYDRKTLLVPGVPEATDDIAAVDALLAFNRFVNREPAPRAEVRS